MADAKQLKVAAPGDEPPVVATLPPPGAVGPASEPAGAPDPNLADLNLADWWAAEQRRATGLCGGDSDRAGPGHDLLLPSSHAAGPCGPAQPDLDLGTGPSEIAAFVPPPAPFRTRGRGRLYFTRTWAVIKMGCLAYSTWWCLDYIHAPWATTICGYGAVCLFSAFSSHWRKRYFGPGQQLEPGLYEVVEQCLYRVGAVLVLVGGAIVVAKAV